MLAPDKTQYRANTGLFFPPIRLKTQAPHRRRDLRSLRRESGLYWFLAVGIGQHGESAAWPAKLKDLGGVRMMTERYDGTRRSLSRPLTR